MDQQINGWIHQKEMKKIQIELCKYSPIESFNNIYY